MLFTNPTFYLLVIAVLIGVYCLSWKIGRWILIVASYFFYGAAEPWYCLILLTSTLVDFFVAQKLHSYSDAIMRKRWLWVSIGVNLSLLAVFKYADFGIANLNWLLESIGIPTVDYLELLLPIGISFYTFQTLSYTIDVYRGKQTPTRNFAAFALYVGFFPQLVAGPIERARHLLPQFEFKPTITQADLEYGFQRILWGLMKKTVFADRLAVTVNQVFSNPAAYSSTELALATVCFSFQLYLDFSAYTDIAIGVARLFGIRLSENFNYPFLCRNPSDFWSRWHITLTNWFRDYVYNSMGGTRRSRPGFTAFSLLTVMSIMGLWHGAAWHFVIFGLLSGLLLVFYIFARVWIGRGRKQLFGNYWWSTPLAILCANVAICFIMIFFRAEDLDDAWKVISGIAQGEWQMRNSFFIPLAVVTTAAIAHGIFGSLKTRFHDISLAPLSRGALWVLMVLLINYAAIDATERFIYFQF